MKAGINRKSGTPTSQSVEEFRAALRHLAALFPSSSTITGNVDDVRDWLLGAQGPGRPYAIPQDYFVRMRDQVVADLRRANKRPTRARIADGLGINVRTLYNYDHRPARLSSGVKISITTPAFKIESGPR